MRISQQIAVIIRLLASMSIFAAVLAVSRAQELTDTSATVRAGRWTYGVLDKSPDSHYALVWGISGRQIDFSQIDQGSPVDGDPVNCIVDCKQHTVVTTISGFQHFPGRNHSSLDVTWEKHGRHVFVVWQSKWNPEGYALVDLVGSHRGRQTDLAGFETALQERVRLATGNLPAVPYAALECKGSFAVNGDLEIHGHVYPSKWPNGWFYECSLLYALDNSGTITSNPPMPVGIVRAMHSVFTSEDSGETYPQSDIVAVYSAKGKLRLRMKITAAIFKGTDIPYERSLVVEKFRDDGARAWSVDAYPAMRLEILSRVHHLLTSVNLSQSRPCVMLTLPEELKYDKSAPDQFPLKVSVEPMAVGKHWGYSALIMYMISSATEVPGVHLATIIDEESNATGKPPKLPGAEWPCDDNGSHVGF